MREFAIHLLDVNGAAEYLGVTPRYVRLLRSRREIPIIKIGALVRFDPADLDAFVAANKEDALAGPLAPPLQSVANEGLHGRPRARRIAK